MQKLLVSSRWEAVGDVVHPEEVELSVRLLWWDGALMLFHLLFSALFLLK